jgi:gamma-D-glutamyl-L-lysine dipeptidyl-peptidase
MYFAICNVPVAPLRKDPSQTSEMVSSLVYGDKVEVLEIANKWFVKVVTHYEHYEGFVAVNQLEHIAEKYYHAPQALVTSTHGILKEKERQMLLPAGALITEAEAKNFLGNIVNSQENDFSVSAFTAISESFLFAPYLWGGKSSFGCDCSGLVQTMYKMFNIHLPRDASQQANKGQTVNFLQEAQPGDAAFFDDEEGKIIHVGLLLSNELILHAAGNVHIDPIDSAGILKKETGERTHQLRIIKRFI